jgi:hypothetical protein
VKARSYELRALCLRGARRLCCPPCRLPRQNLWPRGVAVSEIVEVELLRCSRCKCVFAICSSCFRGQGYCSSSCRAAGSRDLHRAANARHQQSDAGRLDHRDRMRALRDRRRSVTDSGSTKLASPVDCVSPVPAIARRSIRVSLFKVFVVDVAGAIEVLRCRACGIAGTHIVRKRSRAPP